MKRYCTTDIFDLYQGVVGLTPLQVKTRLHNLRMISDGIYEIISPVQFKAGEVLLLEDLPKTVLGKLECLDTEEEPQADPEPERVAEQPPALPADGKHRGRRKQRR